MDALQLTQNVLVCLLAATLAVPGARKLGLGSVPGYLLAGIVIGPWGLALIRNADEIAAITNIGLVSLLFIVGLDLRKERLAPIRKNMLALGAGYSLLVTLVIFLVALLLGRSWNIALSSGLALSLGSLVVVQQYLRERNLLDSSFGRFAHALLFSQAILLIPLMLLLPVLAVGDPLTAREDWGTAIVSLGVVAAMIVVGHYLLKLGFRYITDLRLPDMFAAYTVLVVLAVVLVLHAGGLSIAVGAFVSGLLVANAEFGRKVERDLTPFKGVLIGMFFVAFGLIIDFGLLLQRPSETLGLLLVLLVVKGTVLYGTLWLLEIWNRKHTALSVLQKPAFCLLFSQGGEFGYILLSVGVNQQVLPGRLEGMLLNIVAFSLFLTPLLLVLLARYEPGYRGPSPNISALPGFGHTYSGESVTPSAENLDSDGAFIPNDESLVVVAGFGRFGQVVSRVLLSKDVQLSVIDHDPVHLSPVQRITEASGIEVFYGDARRFDLLRQAGAEVADVLVIAVDDPSQTIELATLAREWFPELAQVARARDRRHYRQLVEAGVDIVEREVFASALLAGEDVLTLLGYDIDEVERASEAFADHDHRLLHESIDALTKSEDKAALLDDRLNLEDQASELLELIRGDVAQRKLEHQIEEDDNYGPRQ